MLNTKQVLKIEEMQKAFEKVKRGKEADLEQIQLIFFDKEKNLLKKYKTLQSTFEEYKRDIERECDLKEDIIKRLNFDKEQLMMELDLAKLIICERELVQAVQAHYKETIDNFNRNKFLQGSGFIHDLI